MPPALFLLVGFPTPADPLGQDCQPHRQWVRYPEAVLNYGLQITNYDNLMRAKIGSLNERNKFLVDIIIQSLHDVARKVHCAIYE